MQGLSFQNLTNQTVWLILLYADSSCGAANQNFRKQGWWKLNPGQTVVVWNADLRTVNRYIYFEAEFDADKPSGAATATPGSRSPTITSTSARSTKPGATDGSIASNWMSAEPCR